MTETLLRDQVELKRQQSRETDLNRFGGIEKEIAVLRTIVDAHLKAYAESGISDEDIKELRRELEAKVIDTVKTANEQQSRVILGEVRSLLDSQRNAQAEDQKQLRRQVALMVLGSAFSLLGALIFFWMTRNG